MCNAEYPKEAKQSFRLHILKCAKQNEDLIDREVAINRADEFTNPESTAEEFAWVRRKAIAEGVRGKGLN